MKLLLTSDGISTNQLKFYFKKLFPKIKTVLVMICQIDMKKELKYKRKMIQELEFLGISRKNTNFVNIQNEVNAKSYSINDYDLFYSCGGNTFLILDRVRKTGFDKFIKRFVIKDKVYVGASAGSILVHKDIKIAGWGSEADDNFLHLKNLKGLDLINLAIFPHYKDSLREEVIEFKRKVSYPVKVLRDGQALYYNDSQLKLIK